MEKNPHTELIRFDSVEPKDPQYLWWPYVRSGNINTLSADGGMGKTSMTLALMAALANGRMPEGMPGELRIEGAANSMYIGGEDEIATYAGMLEKFGCNRQCVYTIDPANMPTIGESERLEKLIRDSNAKLIVFDPIQAVLSPGSDMNKASSVRPQMEALRRVCNSTGCAALLLMHFNKASSMFSKAAYRTAGSTDFTNAARSCMSILQHPRDKDKRIVFHTKENFARGDPFVISISDDGFQWWNTCTEFSERECLEASDNHSQSNAQEDHKARIAVQVICALMAGQQSWAGTCKRMLEALPQWSAEIDERALGRRLQSDQVRNALRVQDITINKKSPTSMVYEIRRKDMLDGDASG